MNDRARKEKGEIKATKLLVTLGEFYLRPVVNIKLPHITCISETDRQTQMTRFVFLVSHSIISSGSP